jgi:curved DNA-binding protein CbpA
MAVQFQDYYGTLGVPRTATPDEIKHAFRKLAMIYHPDVARDKVLGTVKFREVREAYEVLSSPAQRQKYDEIDAGWQHPPSASETAPSPDSAPRRDPFRAAPPPVDPPPRRDRGFRINFAEDPPPPEPFEAEFSDFYKTYFTRAPSPPSTFRDTALPDDPHDPQAPRKSAKWFYRSADGREQGPYELLELAAMLRCGDITGATSTRTEADSWMPFQERHEFAWARDMPTEVLYRHLDRRTEGEKEGFTFTFRKIYYLFAFIIGMLGYALMPRFGNESIAYGHGSNLLSFLYNALLHTFGNNN